MHTRARPAGSAKARPQPRPKGALQYCFTAIIAVASALPPVNKIVKRKKSKSSRVAGQGRARHRQGPQPAAGGPGPLRRRRGRRLPVYARGPGARVQLASIIRTCTLAPAVLHADVCLRCCCLRSAMACSGGGWGTTQGGESGPADRACVRLQEALHANTTGLPYPYDSCGIRGLEYDRCHLISCLPQTGRPEASLHTAHQDRDL